MVVAVDLIDKGIFYALDANCRTSYETLARQFKISANAVKKRVHKLQEIGILKRYSIRLSLGMINAEQVVAFVETDEKQDDEAIINTIGDNPMIDRAAFLSTGTIMLFGEYCGVHGLAELSRFLRGLNGVKNVEIHTLLTEKGEKVEFTPLQLKVLRCLKEDARMSIVKLAKETGLTARTIRRVLDQLGGNRATVRAFVVRDDIRSENLASNEPIHFRTIWNLNAGGNIAFVARLSYEENLGNPADVVNWLKEKYPLAHWYSYTSASEPILFSTFVVERLGQMEQITRELKKGPLIETVQTLVSYPFRHFKGLSETLLDEMLQ